MSFHKFPIDNQQRKNSIVNIRRDKGASIWFLRGYRSEMAPGTVKRAISRYCVKIGPQLMTADRRKSFIHFALLEHRGVNFKPKTPSSFMPRKEKKTIKEGRSTILI